MICHIFLIFLIFLSIQAVWCQDEVPTPESCPNSHVREGHCYKDFIKFSRIKSDVTSSLQCCRLDRYKDCLLEELPVACHHGIVDITFGDDQELKDSCSSTSHRSIECNIAFNQNVVIAIFACLVCLSLIFSLVSCLKTMFSCCCIPEPSPRIGDSFKV